MSTTSVILNDATYSTHGPLAMIIGAIESAGLSIQDFEATVMDTPEGVLVAEDLWCVHKDHILVLQIKFAQDPEKNDFALAMFPLKEGDWDIEAGIGIQSTDDGKTWSSFFVPELEHTEPVTMFATCILAMYEEAHPREPTQAHDAERLIRALATIFAVLAEDD